MPWRCKIHSRAVASSLKMKGALRRPKGEDSIDVELPIPVHAHEVPVIRMDGHQAEGTLNIELCQVAAPGRGEECS